MSARFLTNKQCEIWCERYRSDNECEYYSDKPLCWWAGRALPRLLGITWARFKMIAIHMPSTTLSEKYGIIHLESAGLIIIKSKKTLHQSKFSLRRLYYTDEKNKHKYATSSLLWQRHVIPSGNSTCPRCWGCEAGLLYGWAQISTILECQSVRSLPWWRRWV